MAEQAKELKPAIKGEEKLDMKYKVNLKKTEEGYAIWVPGLPGCWSQGKSEDDALENIKDAGLIINEFKKNRISPKCKVAGKTL